MALVIGLFYMYLLTTVGYHLCIAPTDDILILLPYAVFFLFYILPVLLTFSYSMIFRQAELFSFLITAIPALMAILIDHFLLDFVPVIFRGRGIMLTKLETAPSDIAGQILQALPFVLWVVITASIGIFLKRIAIAAKARFFS